MESPIGREEFRSLLPSICDRETSQDPGSWKPENPLWGHCAVVSAVAQNLFGGKLKRASLESNPGFGRGSSHYWNELPGGEEEDFTRDQFGSAYPVLPDPAERTRGYVLFGPDDAAEEVKKRFEGTRKRYKLLAWRLARRLTRSPLFDNEIYRRCFDAALESRCQKMWFGCVITRYVGYKNYIVVYEGGNQTIGLLKSFCEPECIRFKITSRTESMLGACGHAEELGIWEIVRRGISLGTCELYIAGFHTTGMPWFKKAPEHTCLRCAVQMYHAGVGKIHVPMSGGWVGMTAEEALRTARAYATQEKKV